MKKISFPDGKRFAFSIIDDTDVATLENIKPVYDLLVDLDMRATKTVWPVGCPEGSKNYSSSNTLEDPEYLSFVKELKSKGFEITWHSATMESSKRDRIEAALEVFKREFGEYPHIHVNHSFNKESMYWGDARIDMPLLKYLYRKISSKNQNYFLGHIKGTPYWWGDHCKKHITYARNLTCTDINTSKYNPSMPYRDKNRTLVPWWFSSSSADNVIDFNDLIRPDNQMRLEEEGGFCMVSTHFGKKFVVDGKIDEEFKSRLTLLAERDGWFPNAGELLDWLRKNRTGRESLSAFEWRKMQLFWARDLLIRNIRSLRKKNSH